MNDRVDTKDAVPTSAFKEINSDGTGSLLTVEPDIFDRAVGFRVLVTIHDLKWNVNDQYDRINSEMIWLTTEQVDALIESLRFWRDDVAKRNA